MSRAHATANWLSSPSPGRRSESLAAFRFRGSHRPLLPNTSGSRLYAAVDTTSHVEVFDTARNVRIEQIDTVGPAGVYENQKMLSGANTNALVLTPDERTLLVSNGGQNSVAVVRLSATARGTAPRQKERDGDENDSHDDSATIGLVPTGWYPTGVATSKNGATWYIVNGKSPMGPNDAWCNTAGGVYCDPKVAPRTMAWTYAGNGIAQLLAKNTHVNQLEHAGFLTMPGPDGVELARLTKLVARNNGLDQATKAAADERLFSFLRGHIKHVIYIMKQNRSYDQVFGDLGVGNGDPRLTFFPEKISPQSPCYCPEFRHAG